MSARILVGRASGGRPPAAVEIMPEGVIAAVRNPDKRGEDEPLIEYAFAPLGELSLIHI